MKNPRQCLLPAPGPDRAGRNARPTTGGPRWGGHSCLPSAIRSALVALTALLAIAAPALRAQEPGSLPEGPKPVEDFEVDADSDGVPDGWYNLRDAKVVEGGVGGSTKTKCLRFENTRPGRPARASRAFGVDGRQFEAVVIGAWIRQESIAPGERLGDDPGLVVDFLSDPLQLRTVRRGSLGPWKAVGREWTHVAKKMPIPPETRLAILSTGLLGATGVLEVDNLTVDLVPVGGKPTSNLVVNGDFEVGDPDAASWLMDHGARRSFPGNRSNAAAELKGAGARAYSGLALPVGRFNKLEVSATAKANGLRGEPGAIGFVFFLDDDGRPLPGLSEGVAALKFSGSFNWTTSQGSVDVPPSAARALIHFEKEKAFGTLWVDDVQVTGVGGEAAWTPDHVETPKQGWQAVEPSASIAPKSALDASSLLDAPAGKHGFVSVKEGRLAFAQGGRARFFGVSLLPPTAFLDPPRADELADRLARSGVNLVRLSDLDVPLGPGRSLFDDVRDDTKELDAEALAKLDHLVAALKARGIYVAIELQSARRFRDGDADTIAGARMLPPGGGPAAAFDPAVREAARKAAEALLSHVNPETKLALKDDPALAWVTLAGELSLFDLVDAAEKEMKSEADAVRTLMRKDNVSATRRTWMATEADQWRGLAADLRKAGVKVPIAGGSHWRRDYDIAAVEATDGLDLIDDRLYYTPPSWAGAERRSLLFSRDGGLIAGASRKRKPNKPYVVGQYAVPTHGTWASPWEGAELLLAAQTAAAEDWDALVRRGVFLFPKVWGSGAAGTGGGEDIFALAEVVNGIPQALALLPHAASILLRPAGPSAPGRAGPAASKPSRAGAGAGGSAVPGWNAREGRLQVATPYTKALAGFVGEASATADGLAISVNAPFGVVAVTSLGPEPIATSKRLLVTAVARVEPTGFRWSDEWRRERGEPGLPPLLHEGLRAKISWQRPGEIKAYALDNTGARVAPAPLEKLDNGVRLAVDGQRSPTIHWEIVVE